MSSGRLPFIDGLRGAAGLHPRWDGPEAGPDVADVLVHLVVARQPLLHRHELPVRVPYVGEEEQARLRFVHVEADARQEKVTA